MSDTKTLSVQIKKRYDESSLNPRPRSWILILLIVVVVLGFVFVLFVGIENDLSLPSFLSASTSIETFQQKVSSQDPSVEKSKQKQLRVSSLDESSNSHNAEGSESKNKPVELVVSNEKLVSSNDMADHDDRDVLGKTQKPTGRAHGNPKEQQNQVGNPKMKVNNSERNNQGHGSHEEENLDQDTKEEDIHSFVIDSEQQQQQPQSSQESHANSKIKNGSTTTPQAVESELDKENNKQSKKDGDDDHTKQKELDGKLVEFPECASSRRQEHPGLDDGPRVQYIHVPKAGGTSIQAATVDWVKRFSGVGRCSLFKYDGNAVRGSSSKCPPQAFTATILTGHRGFGYCDNIKTSAKGLFTFTALREPVSRMVSSYDYYLYNLQEERAVNVFGKQGLEFGDIVKKYNATEEQEWGERLIRYSGQQQARFLCGYECMGPVAKGNRNFTEEYILEKAIQNLEKIDVIGITEELDDFINQLRFHLPRLIPVGYSKFKRENSHTKKSILDDEAKLILRKWGWVDLTLYKRALEIYRKKQDLATRCLQLFGELDGEPESDP